MKPYLIFDFDGVLADSWELLVNFQKDVDNVKKEEIEAKFKEYFLQPKHSKKVDFDQEKQAKQQARLDAVIPHYGSDIFPLFQGFVDEVAKINTEYLAIVSSGSNKYLLPTTATTPLKFTHVLGFEDHHSKEEKVETICKDWGVSPQEIYYFTDTVSDVIELRDFIDSTKIIGCSWGFHGYETLSTVLPKEQLLVEFEDVHNLFR